MPNSELVSYITEQTQEGVSADVLRQALMDRGWKERDIENALHDVAAGLHPTTPGVSIHADLAQVRGMVAHLATRVKTLEAHLTSAGLLDMQKELPAPKRHRLRKVLWWIALLVLVGVLVWLIRQP